MLQVESGDLQRRKDLLLSVEEVSANPLTQKSDLDITVATAEYGACLRFSRTLCLSFSFVLLVHLLYFTFNPLTDFTFNPLTEERIFRSTAIFTAAWGARL